MQQADAKATKQFEALADVECLSLTYTEVRNIRRALLIGLQSLGEIERLEAEFEILRHSRPELVDGEKLQWLSPVHPSGSTQTIGEFAAALRAIDRV